MATVTKLKRTPGRPQSVSSVTEYGATFNKIDEERIAAGLRPLTTAIEVLIMAIQPESSLDDRDKARIADKLASFESSRAPIISIEHVQNVQRDNEEDAEGALENFMLSLKKV